MGLSSGDEPSLLKASLALIVTLRASSECSTRVAIYWAFSISNLLSTSESVTGGTDGLDVQNTKDDDMDEETPESSSTTELSLGGIGGFGLGFAFNLTAPKPNPFGGSFGNAATYPTSLFSRPTPSGKLFQLASFNFQSLQSSQSS
ncbi:hypothetical protein C1H46_017788 [Malus baccata]|uniref:Uncharacterized protein n=1 Tax=Malus baccata TaxID=106549 RepID=A0A540MCZ7_MALBA|nr:hypothetical protein C1H46_017788 [Malus baccata]